MIFFIGSYQKSAIKVQSSSVRETNLCLLIINYKLNCKVGSDAFK